MPFPHCQCSPLCANPPLEGSPFCKAHSKGRCGRKALLSGFEPAYNPSRYNQEPTVKNSHNCFAYAFNVMDLPSPNSCNKTRCNVPFHQPGRKSGYPRWTNTPDKRCPDLIARLKADVPGLTLTNFTRRCPRGTSKIAVVVDPKHDYHFYRQDSNHLWSHKPGGTSVTRLDATDRPIYDPELASRDYSNKPNGYLDYKHFCSYMCVPRRKTHRFKRGGAYRKATTRKATRKTIR
jgi:hypothetical protein